MDLFDFIPIAPGGSRRGDRPANEEAAAAVAMGLIPVLYLMLLASSELYKKPHLSLVVMPLLLGALTAMLCRALQVRTAQGVLYALACAGMCVLAVFGMFVIDVMIFPF